VIEKVSLKREILDMLDMPLKMLFSQVGKLEIKLPWKNLSSSPIEVCLEDVYIVVGGKS
jgi:vacuolar protein sorting-associated protein 13A/C